MTDGERLVWGPASPKTDTGLLELVYESAARAGRELGRKPLLMEVCGTHTTAIGRSGLRGVLAGKVDLRSGPGCPVCVTPGGDLQLAAGVAAIPGVALATFGDMLRVPFGRTTLERERGRGADVRMVYSPADALAMAVAEPDREVVLLAVGFETTAPLTGAAIVEARSRAVRNFSVLCLHKLVPPALRALLDGGSCRVDGFILPGHVSTVIGRQAFSFLASEYAVPGAVTGFDPGGILLGLLVLLTCLARRKPLVINAYPGVVAEHGNQLARELVDTVFEKGPSYWRGLGEIPDSGLGIRGSFEEFDARLRFGLESVPPLQENACRCGDVLCGRIVPTQCPHFGTACTPCSPVGPCMVSSEGACAAFHRYDRAWPAGRSGRARGAQAGGG